MLSSPPRPTPFPSTPRSRWALAWGLALASLTCSHRVGAQIEVRDPHGPPVPALAGCNTPADGLERIKSGLGRLTDAAAMEQSGGDVSHIVKDALAQLEAMGQRWPDAGETLAAKIAFFKSGLVGFSRAESEKMLQEIDLEKASDEQLLVLGDVSLALNQLDRDRAILARLLARKPTLQEKFALWFTLSGEGTIVARGKALKELMAAAAKGPEEAAEVALKTADWELAFGSRDKAHYQVLLRGVADAHGNTTAGRIATAKLAVARLAPGEPMPQFQVETTDGRKLANADARGKYTLLWFWADWWPTLGDDAAALQSALNDGEEPGVLLLSVGLNWNDPKLQERLGARKLSIPGHVVDGSQDPGRFLSLAYGARQGVSESCKLYLFDPDGKLLAANLPPAEVGAKLADARSKAKREGARRVIRRR